MIVDLQAPEEWDAALDDAFSHLIDLRDVSRIEATGGWNVVLATHRTAVVVEPNLHDDDPSIQLYAVFAVAGEGRGLDLDLAARAIREVDGATGLRTAWLRDPHGSGRAALAITTTLYLDGLDPPELASALRAVAGSADLLA